MLPKKVELQNETPPNIVEGIILSNDYFDFLKMVPLY